MKKSVAVCLALLNAARKRMTTIIQSEEAKAFARRVRTETGKDASRFADALKRKTMKGIEEIERTLKKAKALLKKRKK